jgi:putative ABC transport system substrate-binding protein
MRESCTSGSVRGARGNSRPYRDRRRQFITLLGGTAAWPIAARAQQAGLPVVAYFRGGSQVSDPLRLEAFRSGLANMGFEEGRNVFIDYRFAEGHYDRLQAMAADLVRRKVTVIYAADAAAALAAKAATTALPVVFRIGRDPVQLGLVPSLSRPGGNLTGVSFLSTATQQIRVQMLHEAVPNAHVFAFLVNPASPDVGVSTDETKAATRKLGIELHVLGASSSQGIDAAFATLVERRVQALIIGGDPFFTSRRQQLAALTARHAIPAVYPSRDLADAGLLMSYGASIAEASRLVGIYVGRVLKGDQPANLPVQQSTKVELIINLIIAKALGLTVPLTLLGRADEVIE